MHKIIASRYAGLFRDSELGIEHKAIHTVERTNDKRPQWLVRVEYGSSSSLEHHKTMKSAMARLASLPSGFVREVGFVTTCLYCRTECKSAYFCNAECQAAFKAMPDDLCDGGYYNTEDFYR